MFSSHVWLVCTILHNTDIKHYPCHRKFYWIAFFLFCFVRVFPYFNIFISTDLGFTLRRWHPVVMSQCLEVSELASSSLCVYVLTRRHSKSGAALCEWMPVLPILSKPFHYSWHLSFHLHKTYLMELFWGVNSIKYLLFNKNNQLFTGNMRTGRGFCPDSHPAFISHLSFAGHCVQHLWLFSLICCQPRCHPLQEPCSAPTLYFVPDSPFIDQTVSWNNISIHTLSFAQKFCLEY